MPYKNNKTILVTGGAGYIGSHMVNLLCNNGFKVVVIDNLSTGQKSWVNPKATFVKGDLRIQHDCKRLFKKFKFDAVMHFAASIIVPESFVKPIAYYENNVLTSINLLAAMKESAVKNLIFSSTAAVYSEPKKIPVTEDALTAPNNPYGRSKLMVEQILKDCAVVDDLNFIILRYFNVGGWDEAQIKRVTKYREVTHLIGNIMGCICQGKPVTIYGNTYKTSDGTGLRDYVHVNDLCKAHLKALQLLLKTTKTREIINIGNGKGFTVMEVLTSATKITTRDIPFVVGPKRPNEIVRMVAGFNKAKKILGWSPTIGLDQMLSSEWQLRKHLKMV